MVWLLCVVGIGKISCEKTISLILTNNFWFRYVGAWSSQSLEVALRIQGERLKYTSGSAWLLGLPLRPLSLALLVGGYLLGPGCHWSVAPKYIQSDGLGLDANTRLLRPFSCDYASGTFMTTQPYTPKSRWKSWAKCPLYCLFLLWLLTN